VVELNSTPIKYCITRYRSIAPNLVYQNHWNGLNTYLPSVEREDNRSRNKPLIFQIVALSGHPDL